MLRHPLFRFAVGLTCCAALAWVLYRLLGPVGILFAALPFGLALRRPLVDLLFEIVPALRRLAYHDVEGRHYVFKRAPIDVVEDDAGYRWLRLADVRPILPGLPADAVLARVLGAGFAHGDFSTAARVQADALLGALRKASDPRSLRFRHWLEREIVLPADKRRERGR